VASSDFKSGFKALGQFRTKLEASDRLLLNHSKEMRRDVLALIDEGFEQRKDPVGHKWRRRKKRYPWPILNKTLALRKGWKATTAGKRGVDLTNRVPYTGFHQHGTPRMVARKMVPDQRLSPRWRHRLMKTWNRVNGKHWGFT
jgi:phage gpG-like protein